LKRQSRLRRPFELNYSLTQTRRE
jgi:hypothetical protein